MSGWSGDDTPLLGPRPASAFGRSNLLMTGTGTWYHVPSFAGPISIKAVQRGEVEWRVAGRSRVLRPDTLLLLPDGCEYGITIDTPSPSQTFCPVFRRGLVEAALDGLERPEERLLDDPFEVSARAGFAPRWESRATPLGRAVDALADAVAKAAPPQALGWAFVTLAGRMAEAVVAHGREAARLPAARAATRRETHRRLLAAREAMEADLAAPWTLIAMARAACLSPFHFDRRFGEAFQETPRAWLARRRAERARALLATTDISVTEASLAVGCQSLGSFSSAFRRRFGVSPSAVRRASADA